MQYIRRRPQSSVPDRTERSPYHNMCLKPWRKRPSWPGNKYKKKMGENLNHTHYLSLHLQSLLAICMRLGDDQNKLTIFIKHILFCKSSSDQSTYYKFNHKKLITKTLLASQSNITWRNIWQIRIWFMYIWKKARTMVLLLLITLSTPTEPLL